MIRCGLVSATLHLEILQRKLNWHSLAEILQTYDTSLDAGDTIDLDNFLSEIVSVFKHHDDEQEDEPTLQAAMLATADYPEQPFRDVRKHQALEGHQERHPS